MHDELLFDKIEAWLKGRLSPSEAAAFEAEVAADPELAALVQQHRTEQQALEWLVERDLMAKMDSWEREGSSSGSGSSSNSGSGTPATATATAPAPATVLRVRRLWWATGVAAALAVAFFGWWLLQPQADIGGPSPVVTVPKTTPSGKTPPKTTPKPAPKTTPAPILQDDEDRVAETPNPKVLEPAKPQTPASVDYQALAARYYRSDDFLRETQGATGAAESPGYGQALDSYKSGKYADVEKLLKPALKNDPDALKTKELLAHSLYQRGQYSEALIYFRQLVGARDRSLAERSEWAMALTLLHQLPAQKALLDRTLDRIVAKPGHAFGGKARELKTRISS